MKFALVNPNWTFTGSVYFGCKEPHLPLELGYGASLLQQAGYEARIFDAHLEGLSDNELKQRIDAYDPDFTVVTTAPTYLFWRCAQPELRLPQETIAMLRGRDSFLIAVGPHCSATPHAALAKLGADFVVMGECEEVLPDLARGAEMGWEAVQSIAYRKNGADIIQGGCRETGLGDLPPIEWPDEIIAKHGHHHHRFDSAPRGPGAEMEASRGCPFHCTFCAKKHFRSRYRVRPLPIVLQELDRLIDQGVEYVYFIDELFMPDRELLTALAERPVVFGVQTRIDIWSPEALDLLGHAGCVSLEAGVESVTKAGRSHLNKDCALTNDAIADRLIRAKQSIPFVQANLLRMDTDDADVVEAWRKKIISQGIWANDPVPLFPYPGSDDYARLFGPIDDQAWEKAHAHYLLSNPSFSDIQSGKPLPLAELEH